MVFTVNFYGKHPGLSVRLCPTTLRFHVRRRDLQIEIGFELFTAIRADAVAEPDVRVA
jgi:hypothetical protein